MEQDDWFSGVKTVRVNAATLDRNNGVVGLNMSDGSAIMTSICDGDSVVELAISNAACSKICGNDSIAANPYTTIDTVRVTSSSGDVTWVNESQQKLGGSQVNFYERESNDGMLEELKKLGFVEGSNTEVKKSSDKILKPSFKSVYINKAGKKKYNVKPY